MRRIFATVLAAVIVALTSDPSAARVKLRMSSPKKPVATAPAKPLPAANHQRSGGVFVGIGLPLRPFAAGRRAEPDAAPYSGPARFMPETPAEQTPAEPVKANPIADPPKAQPAAKPARPVVVSMSIPARPQTRTTPAPVGKPVYCQVQASGVCKPF